MVSLWTAQAWNELSGVGGLNRLYRVAVPDFTALAKVYQLAVNILYVSFTLRKY